MSKQVIYIVSYWCRADKIKQLYCEVYEKPPNLSDKDFRLNLISDHNLVGHRVKSIKTRPKP